MKYLSHSQLNGHYLNATIIARNRTSNISSCQRFCIRTNGCFSININISLNKDYDCQLLSNSTNLYMNKSLLVKDKDFIHLYVKSRIQTTVIHANARRMQHLIHGERIVKTLPVRGAQAADYYWSFDNIDGEKIILEKNGKTYQMHCSSAHKNRVLRMPGRRSPVLYCNPADSGHCTQTCSFNMKSINTLKDCNTGVTYSIWIKFTQEELRKQRRSYIMGNSQRNKAGIIFWANDDRSNGYTFEFRAGAKWWFLVFGHNVLAYRWTHFAITFQKDSGICAYVNGVLNKCGGTVSNQKTALESSCFRLGYYTTSSPVSGMFMDDFATWCTTLSETAVKEVYAFGKA
eukprot:gene9489-10480_t